MAEIDERIHELDVLSLTFAEILSGNQKCVIETVEANDMYEVGDQFCICESDQFTKELTGREIFADITHRESINNSIGVYSIEVFDGEGI